MKPLSAFDRDDSRATRCRDGVTLLEVLIAIMVMAIGLLGLASLLPVGRLEMARANQAMRASTIGRSGFRELSIRGALSPQRWLFYGSSSPASVVSSTVDSTTGLTTFSAALAGSISATPVRLPYTPLVIDPLMTAINSANGVLTNKAIAQFPYASQLAAASSCVLPRITLSAVPGTTVSMGMGAADAVFRSTDDLIFNLPNGARSRPMGSFMFLQSTQYAGQTVPSKRLSNGDISWFATVTPDVFQAAGAQAWLPSSPTAGGASGQHVQAMGGALNIRQYQISVAACFKRDLPNLGTAAIQGITSERSAKVAFGASSGVVPGSSTTFSTSEAYISIPNTMSQSDAEQYLGVQPEQWIMITGLAQNYTEGAAKPQIIMNWYRIAGAATNVDQYSGVQGLSASDWSRPLRLDGPDWDTNWLNPSAIIVDGVFGVFQKTVTSDNTSAWTR